MGPLTRVARAQLLLPRHFHAIPTHFFRMADSGSRAKRWLFTINNWTQNELQTVLDSGRASASYLVVGKEVGEETGTPHLQGYVEWNAAVRRATCCNRLGGRARVEVARGSAQENRTYCTKEGDFEEIGECPTVGQGRRSDLDRFFGWVDEFIEANNRPPTTPEAAGIHPNVIVKYARIMEVVRLRSQRRLFIEQPQPKQWQQALKDRLEQPADDRKIFFVVDAEGGIGKSWFVRWFLDMHPTETQLFRPAKVTDLAHAIKTHTKWFLFDVPRNGMQFLQYQVLEQLKDRVIFSPKYNSTTKMLTSVPHVVVFCNEQPIEGQMTADRYHYINFFNT